MIKVQPLISIVEIFEVCIHVKLIAKIVSLLQDISQILSQITMADAYEGFNLQNVLINL